MPPPVPLVPEGWKAEFDDRYQEWYYVNLHTGRSQWERPDRPAQPDGAAPPPGYEASTRDRRDPDPRARDRPDTYYASPRPASQSQSVREASYGYPQPQYGYNGYGYNPAYPPQTAYPTQYPTAYQNGPYQAQAPPNQKQKKGMGKMGAAALGVGGGLLGGFLLGEGIEALEDDFAGPPPPGPDFGDFGGGFGPF
ncbi:WW domain-containing protein wwm1 [Aspergillus brasiliensis]|uniref:WW domain-containing protein wwm1 n=1 Tax=Aspergillus brasiliensis TaxID=319629 RepID=A0A9W6DRM9_9EURO|nr:WW domain-containing protein wwm1 [Aspergillus brasiliensis]GKZ48414.1 WW domain-containing protein wwm1 [Aspergillus brasiliensis]